MSNELDIANLRREYHVPHLLDKAVQADPFLQFELWFKDAQEAHVPEINAATLATVDADLNPHARLILIKDFAHSGIVFYTNYLSQKAKDLQANPKASLVIWWQKIARQIRIEGNVAKTTAAESDAYFDSRPRDYQIGAWASEQSAEIADRKILEENFSQVEQRFADKPVPRPPHWGGYRLKPVRFEFWVGGEHRLHDRILYAMNSSGQWQHVRLSP